MKMVFVLEVIKCDRNVSGEQRKKVLMIEA